MAIGSIIQAYGGETPLNKLTRKNPLWFYSIRSKLLLLFLVATLIFTGVNLMTLHFVRQILFASEVFETKTLPGITAASELALTARDIAGHAHRLSYAPTQDELERTLSRVGLLLDQLEAITAKISRKGGEIDVLRLNRLSQTIRSRAQLTFQFAYQRLFLKERYQTALRNTQKSISNVINVFSPDISALTDPAFLSDHHAHLLVSGADHTFQLQFFHLTRQMTRTLNLALNSENPEQIDTLHKEFMDSTRNLAKALGPFSARHAEFSAPLAAALSWSQKPGWGKFFSLKRQDIVLEAATQNFLAEIGRTANQIAEITAEYSDTVFKHFQTHAQGLVKQEQRVILLVFSSVGLTFLFLLIWGILVYRFANRLTIISNSMGKVPTQSSHTRVAVKGFDEIAVMARALEGLLKKALMTHRLSITDELTQVNNRRRFFELASLEADRAKRRPQFCCIMMLDIDNFKRVNDTYGHYAGDKVLVAVAAACSQLIRSVDIFARVGGEEFALLMPETETQGGRIAGERICTEIENTGFEISPSVSLNITVSIGITVVRLCDITVDAAMKQADNALYRAKAAGRNRVVIAGQERP